MSREMNEYELRACLEQEKARNKKLLQEIDQLKQENTKIREWNILWQKKAWDEQMLLDSEWLKGELKELNSNESRILSYIGDLCYNKEGRHLRAIGRALGIPASTTSAALKKLQKKKLVRAYMKDGNKKLYYTLKREKNLIEDIIK
jgi:DNA-binding MarR family transcriptional regulator